MFVQNILNVVLYFVLIVVTLSHVYASDIVYPYHATVERRTSINKGFLKIKQGLTVREVVSILGEPDEIHELYEPKIKNGKKIGFTYWYLIQRIQPNGSHIEKNEKLVRVSFNLNGKVTEVVRW